VSPVHVLLLKGRLNGPSELEELVDSGVLRASAQFLGGTYAGMGVATVSSLTAPVEAEDPDAATVYRLICPNDVQPPCNLAVLGPVRGVVSALEPRSAIAFLLISLTRGSVRSWRDEVRELRVPEGVDEAVAMAYGVKGLHAVVEIASDDLEAVQERVLEHVDHPGVESYELLWTGGGRTRGFGSGRAFTP
jgi:hypothetical protein